MTIDDLIRQAESYSQLNAERLRSAYAFAEKAHAGQTRMSGGPYITHPLAVAMLLAHYQADEDSLIAALLHDVVEDTAFPLMDIEQGFGKSVAKMVDALTKLPHVNSEDQSEFHLFNNKIESIRKIFEVMQEDVRVIVIKLCDRLHNMQSLSAFRPEKQKRIALETLEIFVKIADRLSVGELKEQLEELSFCYLYPDLYQDQKAREANVIESFERGKKKILDLLQRNLPAAQRKSIVFRPHLVYPTEKHVPFKDTEILYEIHVVVEEEKDCFLALQGIHKLWNNIRGTFRDYVTLQRSNGYQALETSVVMEGGMSLRFVIQTQQMYDYSRKGVILECFSQKKSGKKIMLPWIEHLKKIHQETKDKSDDYMTALENDILKGSIIVYTDNNRRLFLPPRSTALDAAFLHYGSLAFRLESITLDQRQVQFSHRLKDWQTIHFHLSDRPKVDYKWLQWVQTSYARSLIFEHLKTLSPQRQHHIAQDLLQQELTEMGSGYLEEVSIKRRLEVAKKLGYRHWSELLEGIATGRHHTQTVVRLLFDQVALQTKKVESEVRIRRGNGPDGITSILEFLQENSALFRHDSTKRVDQLYVDDFSVEWTIAQRSQFFSYVREFLHFEVQELRPLQRSSIPYVYAFAVPLFWALNTFVTRYLLENGLSVENATEIRFASSAFILFLLAAAVRRYYHEDYSRLSFSFSFFFIATVLATYTYLIHKTLFYTESINYIVPVSISFVFVGLFHAFSSFFSRKSFLPVLITTLLCLTSLFLLMSQNLTQGEFFGIGLACLVLFLHMTYNYFGNHYQQKYKVKSRSMLFVASMFFFATVVFLPFVSIDNFLSSSPLVLIIAVLNGFITGGISHFFFFESSKYLQHYKVTLSMSLMVVFTVLMGYWWDHSINSVNLLAALLMIGAYCVAGGYERRTQIKSFSSPQQLG